MRLPAPMTPACFADALAGARAGALAGGVASGAGSGRETRGVRAAGARGASRRGAGDGFGVRARGAARLGSAVALPPTGASLNTDCGGNWRCAIARSRISAESVVAAASSGARSRQPASNTSAGASRESRRREEGMGTMIPTAVGGVPAVVSSAPAALGSYAGLMVRMSVTGSYDVGNIGRLVADPAACGWRVTLPFES